VNLAIDFIVKVLLGLFLLEFLYIMELPQVWVRTSTNQNDSLSLLEIGVNVILKVSFMLFFAWDHILGFHRDFILSRRLLLLSISEMIGK
jgi:hypothetical protein